MFEIILIVYLCFRNSNLSKRKGQKPALWIILTVVSFLVGEVIGGMLAIAFFYKGGLNGLFALGLNNRKEYFNQVNQFMLDPYHYLFILVCAFGGYLLIRYILEKIPDVKKPVKRDINEHIDDGG